MHYSWADGAETWDAEFGEALTELNRLVLATGERVEGNSFYWDDTLTGAGQAPSEQTAKRRFALWRHAKEAKRVLEIGVNAGHGALLMLASRPDLTYTGIDIAEHGYTIPALRWLTERSGGRVQAIIGDSARALPVLAFEGVPVFDFTHVDGAHDLASAAADIFGAWWLTSRDGSILVDDMHLPGPRQAAERAVSQLFLQGEIGPEVAELWRHS